MAKYRKKPVVIDAWPFTAEAWEADCGANEGFQKVYKQNNPAATLPKSAQKELGINQSPWKAEYFIHTLEGEHRVSEGDMIIKGVKNDFYPCKRDIFEMTYEKAE